MIHHNVRSCFALMALAILTANSQADLSGTIYHSEVPKYTAAPAGSPSAAYTLTWEPLSCTFSIETNRVKLDFTAWGYDNLAGSKAFCNIEVNGSIYDSVYYYATVGKTTTPNWIYDKFVPESALSIGENDVKWYLHWTGTVQANKYYFEIYAKVYKSSTGVIDVGGVRCVRVQKRP